MHERFEYEMAAPAAVVFDAFRFHRWRQQWDSLVREDWQRLPESDS